MKDRLRLYFRILTTPSSWRRCYETGIVWDFTLNYLLDEPEFSTCGDNSSSSVILLNGVRIWINEDAGYYSYGIQLMGDGVNPSRKTQYRLHDIIQHHKEQGWILPASQEITVSKEPT